MYRLEEGISQNQATCWSEGSHLVLWLAIRCHLWAHTFTLKLVKLSVLNYSGNFFWQLWYKGGVGGEPQGCDATDLGPCSTLQAPVCEAPWCEWW